MTMKNMIIRCGALLSAALFWAMSCVAQPASSDTYLASLREPMNARWPLNRTVNIVFHGHSVPAGYARTPVVATLDAYPYQTLVTVKKYYPNAVVNTITTAIGGEDAEQGSARFASEVLTHRPDVVFIDYALNDRKLGLERAEKGWRKMIEEALQAGVKVVLCTPTPDLSARMTSPDDPLTQHAEMIRRLAAEYHVGLADIYAEFVAMIGRGARIADYMSQSNHPNAAGHQVAVSVIAKWILTPEQFADYSAPAGSNLNSTASD